MQFPITIRENFFMISVSSASNGISCFIHNFFLCWLISIKICLLFQKFILKWHIAFLHLLSPLPFFIVRALKWGGGRNRDKFWFLRMSGLGSIPAAWSWLGNAFGWCCCLVTVRSSNERAQRDQTTQFPVLSDLQCSC